MAAPLAGAAVAGAIKGADNKKLIIMGSIVILGGVLIYFGVVNPILKFTGIKDSKEEKKGKKDFEKLSKKQVLSPKFYNDNRDKVTISSAVAAKAANKIYKGKWGGCCIGDLCTCDDEDSAIAGIKMSGTAVNLSYISKTFNDIYAKDLESYLKGTSNIDYLEDEHWTTVDNYIEKLPRW
jgi:hypothetical protein